MIDLKQQSDMAKLNDRMRNCRLCYISCLSAYPVCGYGRLQSKIVLVGEAPGRVEVLQRRPFVNDAGMFLDIVLESFKIDKNKLYITNAVKHRPVEGEFNRPPIREETDNCSSFLFDELKIIEPKVIIALGKIATEVLFAGKDKIDVNVKRGKIYRFKDLGIISTYHPSHCQRRGGVGNIELFYEVLEHFTTAINYAADCGINLDEYRKD